MSILIKGREMPKNCGECLLARLSPTGESLVCNLDLSTVSWEERPFTCLLVELPPHGRLIDENDFFSDDIVYPSKQFEKGMRAFVSDMPTIIPAEEGKR